MKVDKGSEVEAALNAPPHHAKATAQNKTKESDPGESSDKEAARAMVRT
jgi:hypothetical protein